MIYLLNTSVSVGMPLCKGQSSDVAIAVAPYCYHFMYTHTHTYCDITSNRTTAFLLVSISCYQIYEFTLQNIYVYI